MKKVLRKLFPAPYHYLWVFKNYVHDRILNEPWSHYYDASTPIDHIPEKWLYDIHLPHYVDEILDLGCGAGRNLIPFDGTLKLWGIDIVPADRIR